MIDAEGAAKGAGSLRRLKHRLGLQDLGHPAVGKAVASLLLFRCLGAVVVFLSGIRELGVQPAMPWTITGLTLLTGLNIVLIVLLRGSRRVVLGDRPVLLCDLGLAVIVTLWCSAITAPQMYLVPYQDPLSIYLAGTLTLWTFLLGSRAALWAAALGLMTHWLTGLVNGYGPATFIDMALYERWLWLLLGLAGASMMSRGLADGLRAEGCAREASCRAAQAEAEARVLRDAHGGVLPTLASVRHLALDRVNQHQAILELVHECETAVRRRLVEWNGGWSEVRSGIEDEIARLRKCRQLAGQPALLIDVVEVGSAPPVPPVAVAALVGAVGEAVRNAARHASASRVVVKMRGTVTGLTVVVRDDGNGFRGHEGFGVRHSIREPLRAAGGSA